MKKGRLYGIGVGPGAPDLLTVRATRALAEVDVILAAASSGNDYSISYSVARPYLRSDVEVQQLKFPMTRDLRLLEQAWRKAALTTLDVLGQGKNAAFLTIGDPLAYSTFSYLLKAVKMLCTDPDVEIVPGITSWQAAAARTGFVLCEGEESLAVLSGIAPREQLVRQLKAADKAAILKVYRHYPDIMAALEEAGRLQDSVLISLVEREGETIRKNPSDIASPPPYMSLILSAGQHKTSG